MSQGAKVFLACAIGAFIGTLIALNFGGHWWWLGLIVGGVAGYLSYEFKSVCRAIPTAWRAARQYPLIPRVLWWLFCLVTFAVLSEVILIFALVSLVGGSSFSINWPFTLAGLLIVIMIGFGLVSVPVIYRRGKITPDEIRLFRKIALWCSPPAVMIYLPLRLMYRFAITLPVIIKALPVGAVALVKFIGQFSKNFFRLIHSDIRLLCGVDAAIGTFIGFVFSNPIIGALAGGLLGVVNYEIISKRVLHLVPAKTA